MANNDYKEIIKKYGSVIKDASYILDKEKQIVSVSPALDIGLHGGIEEGTWTMISGAPKCGKTTTALQIARNAQKMGKKIFYLNVEGRLSRKSLRGIKGLNADEVVVISSEPNNILSAEDFLNIASDLIKSTHGCVLIIDSVSQLCSHKELTEDITGQTRSLGPKIMSSFCKHMGGVVPIQNTIIIMINHLITNTSGYGKMYMEDGGRKSQYQVDNKIRQVGLGTTEWKDKDNIVGQIVRWNIEESSIGAPGANVESYIRYGIGIDEVREVIQIAQDLGLIDKRGAWYYLPFIDEETKFQGLEKTYEFLSSEPQHLDKLINQVKEML